MLTVDDVAKLLVCSTKTIYRLTEQKRIPQPVRIGRMIRWPRSSIEYWIMKGCPVPTKEQNLSQINCQNSLRLMPESP